MAEKNLVWYQQGDVTIKPVASIPEGANPVGTRVLREGEATGHVHRATGEGVQLFIHGDTLYMRVEQGTEVVHEEPKPINVPPGLYEIGHYGGRCQCCGERDCRFLSIDHKYNDGYAHRKLKRVNIHDFVIKNGFPDTFQVHCFNCNFGRAFLGGEEKVCPHKFGNPVFV